MNSPAGASPERKVVWPVGNDPTLRLRRPGPPPIRRGLVLGTAAALGVLTGVVTTWADTSPVGPTPDTHQWIAPGADDRLSDVRPRSAADAPSPAPIPTHLAQAKMSELTVVPLSRRTTPSRSVTADPSPTARLRPKAPAPLRSESGEDSRESAEEKREPTPQATTPQATAPEGKDPKAKDPKAKDPKAKTPKEATPKVKGTTEKTPKAKTAKEATPKVKGTTEKTPKAKNAKPSDSASRRDRSGKTKDRSDDDSDVGSGTDDLSGSGS